LNSELILNYHMNMTGSDSTLTFQSSALSRSSAEVFEAASDRPVRVTRRNGEPLVLMTESENSDRDALLELAAQLIDSSSQVERSLAENMADRFPWMLALNAEDRDRCAVDIVSAARASFSTHQAHLAIAEITSWRETASALAAGLGHRSLDWLDDEEIVERP
jgi:PHD/YefM family antitoxin component YafN of YafNO toxin-antitoxin module